MSTKKVISCANRSRRWCRADKCGRCAWNKRWTVKRVGEIFDRIRIHWFGRAERSRARVQHEAVTKQAPEAADLARNLRAPTRWSFLRGLESCVTWFLRRIYINHSPCLLSRLSSTPQDKLINTENPLKSRTLKCIKDDGLKLPGNLFLSFFASRWREIGMKI